MEIKILKNSINGSFSRQKHESKVLDGNEVNLFLKASLLPKNLFSEDTVVETDCGMNNRQILHQRCQKMLNRQGYEVLWIH